jgi:hypothetical protein
MNGHARICAGRAGKKDFSLGFIAVGSGPLGSDIAGQRPAIKRQLNPVCARDWPPIDIKLTMAALAPSKRRSVFRDFAALFGHAGMTRQPD